MAGWAHALWQRKGLDPFIFAALDRRKQAFLIASEMIEEKKPQNAANLILRAIRAYMSRKKRR